ncbi:hypothetical protein L6164_024334 [Bauhinia variegata]|uniref:Uncharacterized protein n=1 Tax=Bauhinia variegata TaxID=167791 RepID=A0ACB9LYE2_BAUVA|nr:hypothetical protein L6164_024334 [Bauhinia variegata]
MAANFFRDKMETPLLCLISVILSLFLVSIISTLYLPAQFTELMRFTTSKPEYSISMDQLRTKVSADRNQLRAVSFREHGHHLHQSQSRNRTATRIVKRLSREEMLEEGLARARASIRSIAVSNLSLATTHSDGGGDIIPAGVVYRNPHLFYQSYMEMEKRFKIYVYPEGDLPITHDGPCKDIYSIEGRFIHELEHGDGRFRTNDANVAHVYFLPFSVTLMVKYLYTPNTYDVSPLKHYVSDYVRVVSTRYPFWNRSQGADHFMLSCHDWGPFASQGNPLLFNTSIRVLCNANASEGFDPRKDISLPEIHLYGGVVSPKLLSPPPDHASRPHLAFFAGGLHGPIRAFLLKHWKNRDNDILVYEYLPKNLDYYSLMLNSKFCLCPSGYEVASPRLVESIYAECVPVILSKNYVLPFSDVLRWEAFSVEVHVSDIPRLKEVLSAIPESKYRKLKEGVRAVRRHFTLNHPPKRYDVFHMILHSIWLRRLNFRLR